MAKCRRCPAVLEGRRQLCDSCKAQRPGTAETVAARKKASGKKAAADEPATAVDVDETTPAIAYPPGLHQRGKLLWQNLGQVKGTAIGELALELCRMADRLDELDRVIAGKGVLQLMKFRLDGIDWDNDGEHVHVNIGFQSVLTEARLQQGTFKELLKEFRSAQASAPPAAAGASPTPTPAAPPPSTGLDEFSQRRAQRVPST